MAISASLASTNIGLILDKGGKDDKSFNSNAFQGISKAQKELGISFKFVEATDLNSLENLHRSFAKKDFDLIIGIGFVQADAIKKVAADFPQKKWILVDGEVNLPNVRSLVFEDHEGSFLVGALAAMKSKSTIIGFIGAMDVPLIRRFHMGFEAGVKNVNPKAKVLVNFLGVTQESWNNPPKAKEQALSQYNVGAEIIFAAAGASGTGVFDAAEEKKKLAIGVDSNQNYLKPGFILTSMLKRVDVAVFEAAREAKNGHFVPGLGRFGLKDHGIDYSMDQFNEKLVSTEYRKRLEELKQKIIRGEIVVPDYYKIPKKKNI